MNKRFFHRILILLLALVLGVALANAQTPAPSLLRDQRIFRGNQHQFPVFDLALTDSATYTATLYYSKTGAALPTNLQPVVTKTPGLLRVKLNSTQALPALTWLEIKANGATRAAANVITDKTAITPPIGYPAILYTMPDEPYISLWQELISYYY